MEAIVPLPPRFDVRDSENLFLNSEKLERFLKSLPSAGRVEGAQIARAELADADETWAPSVHRAVRRHPRPARARPRKVGRSAGSC